MDMILDRLHAAEIEKLAAGEDCCPLSVSISIPGFEITTGLRSADSFVMLGAEPYDDWYVAVGDEKAEGDDNMFYGVHQDTYWAPKHLIPVITARDAVRYFIENYQHSPNLKWDR